MGMSRIEEKNKTDCLQFYSVLTPKKKHPTKQKSILWCLFNVKKLNIAFQLKCSFAITVPFRIYP